MKDLRTIQSLQGLADLLLIPSEPSYIPFKNRGATKVEVYRRNDTLMRLTDSVNQTVDLVLPISTPISRVAIFMIEVGKILSNYNCHSSIASQHRFANRGFVISIDVPTSLLSNLVIQLANMADVVKVEEEPLAITVSPPFPNNPVALLASNIKPNKRIHVCLKDTDMTRYEPAIMLN